MKLFLNINGEGQEMVDGARTIGSYGIDVTNASKALILVSVDETLQE
jgi:hypothetical protein